MLGQALSEDTRRLANIRNPKLIGWWNQALVEGKAKDYIVNIVYQINGTYEYGWYDACAVMLRRLMESLIIEAYIDKGIVDKYWKMETMSHSRD